MKNSYPNCHTEWNSMVLVGISINFKRHKFLFVLLKGNLVIGLFQIKGWKDCVFHKVNYFLSMWKRIALSSVYWLIVCEPSIHDLLCQLVRSLTTTAWTLHGDEAGSIIPWYNSFLTFSNKVFVVIPNCHDFIAIGLQFRGKFGKSKTTTNWSRVRNIQISSQVCIFYL